MAICTPMGPGFFLFFQTCDERAGGYFPSYPKFVPKTREQEKVAPILEDIAQRNIDNNKDLEIILRLRLKRAELTYERLYLTWLKRDLELKRAKKRKNSVIQLLLLH